VDRKGKGKLKRKIADLAKFPLHIDIFRLGDALAALRTFTFGFWRNDKFFRQTRLCARTRRFLKIYDGCVLMNSRQKLGGRDERRAPEPLTSSRYSACNDVWCLGRH
jgi:hypothetical protein